MKKSVVVLASFVAVILLVSLVSIVRCAPDYPPQPWYECFYDKDWQFGNAVNDSISLNPQNPPPARGSVLPFGRWYSGYWGSIDLANSWCYIANHAFYSKSTNWASNPLCWGGATINEGRPTHIAVQCGNFTSGITESLATPVEGYYISNTLMPINMWLNVRATILSRACEQPWNPDSQANLGINLQFQPEWRNIYNNSIYLEDYDNPDFWYGNRYCPACFQCDLFLSQHSWVFGGNFGEASVGSVRFHMMAVADADAHVQVVVGQMPNLNQTYDFRVNLTYAIQQLWNESIGRNYGVDNNLELHGWVLRNIQVYTECTGASVSAVVNWCHIGDGWHFPWDINCDDKCNYADLAILASAYGSSKGVA